MVSDAPTPAEVIDAVDYPTVLAASHRAVEAKDEALTMERRLRDERIWQAINDGHHSWADVGRWAGVSKSHVGDVLGNPDVRRRVLERTGDVDVDQAGEE